jgi:hypothetical protein
MVMSSTVHVFNIIKMYNKPIKLRYVRMLVVDNLEGKVGAKVLENIKYDTVIKIDNYSSYSKVKENVWCHIS